MTTVSVPSASPQDTKIDLRSPRTMADTIFRLVMIGCASTVLLVIVGIVLYLARQSRLAFDRVGVGNLVLGKVWAPPSHLYGILGDLVGSLVIAAVALVVATPISLATAIGINEYVPRRLRAPLTALVDLLAAVPSVVYGLWGRHFLADHLFLTAQWLGHHAAFFPLFRLTPGVNTTFSEFVAGMVVAIMVLPLMTAISREVMSQVPRDDCEAALALGGTRWGMITDVVLPFSRNGIIGGSMLAFGRAIGETIAVALVLAANNQFTSHILQNNGGSVSALIAVQFVGNSRVADSALTAAGLVLFAITLVVNVSARSVIGRSVKR